MPVGIYIRTKKTREILSKAKMGKKMSEEAKEKMSIAQRKRTDIRGGWKLTEENKRNIGKASIGRDNKRYIGNKVGKPGLHKWVRNRLIKPQTCRDCNQPKPLDLANISQQYKRDLSDWEWLCRKCHMTKDGRLTKFRNARRDFLSKTYEAN